MQVYGLPRRLRDGGVPSHASKMQSLLPSRMHRCVVRNAIHVSHLSHATPRKRQKRERSQIASSGGEWEQ